MAAPDQEHQESRTIRELGGEFWAELFYFSEEDIHWRTKDAVVDLLVRVLARHSEKVLVNDEDLPVEPLPLRFPPTDD
jgi:hypothetical protein